MTETLERPETKRKYKPELKSYALDHEAFEKLLALESKNVIVVDDIHKYFWGCRNQGYVYVDAKRETMIIRAAILATYLGQDVDNIGLKLQVRVTKSRDTKLDIIVKNDDNGNKESIGIKQQVNGAFAYSRVLRILLKYYTRKEIDECMAAHSTNKEDGDMQLHYIFDPYEDAVPFGTTPDYNGDVYKVDNCVYYDINGAHHSAVAEIFPKAADEIEELYNERKEHPENKLYFNLFVGMLASKRLEKKYRGTYNWIVQRTSKLLLEKLNHIGGKLIYANTDGFIVQNPTNIDNNSHKLGEFKLEYQGTVYYTHTDNYQLLQYGRGETADLKGTLPLAVRDKVNIDLSTGEIPVFECSMESAHMLNGDEVRYKVIDSIDVVKRHVIDYTTNKEVI